MNVTVKLNESQILQKVTNDTFGIFVAHEWGRLIDDFTPRNRGDLMKTKQTDKPFTIYYPQKYAAVNYYGSKRKFQKNNPFSTHHWDKAAENMGQKDKLIKAINAYLKRR